MSVLSVAESVERIKRDIKNASGSLGIDEARFLVDAYYTMQEGRKRSDNQIRALSESEEPHAVIEWFATQWRTLEGSIKNVLDQYSGADPLGRWAKSICGIGPVISAGLLCHIDVTKNHVSHIWNFAGLSPGIVWEKGCKRPWNAELKTLCAFKLGECLVKNQNNPADFYGRLFAQRRQLEADNNESGKLAEQAKSALSGKRWRDGTATKAKLEQGQLSDAHLHARARRWTVKLFLSHYHTVGHYLRLGKLPQRPFAFDHCGHADIMMPPNVDDIDGLRDAILRWT